MLYAALRSVGFDVECLPQQTDDAQQQREHVEYVVTLVAAAKLVGQQALVAQALVVDGRDAGYPVAQVRLAVALEVVLTAGEIPHEVAPVHVGKLVVEEVSQIGAEAGLPYRGKLHIAPGARAMGGDGCLRGEIRRQLVERGIALLGPAGTGLGGYGVDVGSGVLRPSLVAVDMSGVVAVDAGQQHLQVGHVGIVGIAFFLDILVGLRGVGLDGLLVCGGGVGVRRALLVAQHTVEDACLGAAVGIDVCKVLARAFGILLGDDLLGKGGAVEERTLAILLAVEVRGQGEDVVGRLLVHGRIGMGAYEQQRIRRVAHKDKEYTEDDYVEYTHRHLLAHPEEPHGQRGHQQGGQPPRAYHGHTREHYRHQEAPLDGARRALPVERHDGPYKRGHQQAGVDEHAGVVRQAEAVDRKQLKALRGLDKAGHQAVEYQGHYHHRHAQGYERALSVDIAILAIVEYQHDGGDTEQIEQVHGDGHADHVCDEYEIAVAVRGVGAVFPLEYEPEYQRRAKRREGVYLALDSRKPECVAPRVSQGAADTRAEDERHLPGRRSRVVAHDEAAAEMGHAPEEQQYGGRAEQGRHGIDGDGGVLDIVAEYGDEKAGGEHEDRIARRVTHFEFGALRDKLRAVPEAGSRLQGEEIGDGGHDKTCPAEDVIKQIVLLHA